MAPPVQAPQISRPKGLGPCGIRAQDAIIPHSPKDRQIFTANMRKDAGIVEVDGSKRAKAAGLTPPWKRNLGLAKLANPAVFLV
jgi:hypothetical protein